MLNAIFVFLVVGSVLLAAYGGQMEALSRAIFDSAADAVTLALKLIGAMALFLGLMRVAQEAGLLHGLARAVSPLLRRLFPGVPPAHPAMSAMLLNLTSNMLGLGNAATPFGIKAMQELDRLNPLRGTASDAMVVFLALNTSGFTLLPASVLAARAAARSSDPAGILVPTVLASGCASVVGVTVALALRRLPLWREAPGATRLEERIPHHETAPANGPPAPSRPLAAGIAVGCAVAWTAALVYQLARGFVEGRGTAVAREIASAWPVPAIVAGVVLVGWVRGVRVYAALVEGAKEGFEVAVRILPYLVAVFVMVGMVRASGGMELFVRLCGPWVEPLGLPAEVLPLALLRPLSGSASFAWMSELLRVHGPDTLVGRMASTMHGSTETTFYVLAVYFGAVGVRRTRHTLPSCLLADAAGLLAAVALCRVWWGAS